MLRSTRWFANDDLRGFGHRSRMNQMGYDPEEYVGKPIIAIINPWNEFNTCHTHFPERVKNIKEGILQAGGLPIEIPVFSVGEQLIKPTSMMYRNFLAMEVEEVLKSHPVDGAVLMGGCDKTTPAILMGATSFNIPCIYMPGGAMLRGHYKGETLGSGTDVWRYWDDRQAGKIGDCAWRQLEFGIARSAGTCMTMGTAATMMTLAESLGMALPGSSSIPAVDSSHIRMAKACGRQILKLVEQDIKPKDILTKEAFENAVVTLSAIGGSTNAVVHLIAMAKRAGVPLILDDFERIAADVPLLLNLKPAGKYVMEDLYYAGGIKAMQKILHPRLHNINTVALTPLFENIKDAEVYDTNIIKDLENPVNTGPSIAVLKGNLAPNGAIIKPTACEERLHKHTGKALVYDDITKLKADINREDLDVDENTVLVLQNAGPKGAPGMPEWGQLPIPKKLLKQGIRDILRISDARMSGTSYGACVLHVSPESYIGGALGLVKTGDIIHFDLEKRLLEVKVSDEVLEARRKEFFANKEQSKKQVTGYLKLYLEHVTQAHEGCDFDFLESGDRALDEPKIA